MDIGDIMDQRDSTIFCEYIFSIIIQTTRGILKLVYSYDPENVINRIQVRIGYAMGKLGKLSID